MVLIERDLAVLSQRKLAEEAVDEAPVAKTTWPEVKEPDNLLLKVSQSEAKS